MNALFASYNIPFLAALFCCVACAGLQLAVGGHDADADADVDTGLHAEAHADSADLSLDGLLSALGVGRVPLMLVLVAFLGAFGALGLLINILIAGAFAGYPPGALIPAVLGSLVLAAPLTGWLSGLLGRLAPRSSTAVSNEQLVGRVGVVVSPSVSATYGRVLVRDGHGSLHTVFAVVAAGEPLPERAEVALLAYDEAQRRFIVRALA